MPTPDVRDEKQRIQPHAAPSRSVSIVGCGWVGLAVGRALAQQGYPVRGSTTRSSRRSMLTEAGIEPFVTTFSPEPEPAVPELFRSDVLICTLPPGRSNANEAPYADQIAVLMAQAQAHGIERVIYTSSTGVYPPTEGPVTEEAVDPRTPHGAAAPRRSTAEAVRSAEQIVVTAYPERAVILRLGGLFGPERHPGRFISGRTEVRRPEGPVNMVHQQDVIGTIQTVVEQDTVQGVFNVVAPEHPTRRAFYEAAARDYGGDLPTFADDSNTKGKRVVSTKLMDTLGYVFTYPDPTAAFRQEA